MAKADEAVPGSSAEGQWVLLRMIPSVGRDEDFKAGLQLSLEVDFPPRPSRLTVPRRVSPVRKAINDYPSVLGVGRHGRLLLYANQGQDPEEPIIVDGFYTEPLSDDVRSGFEPCLYICDIRNCTTTLIPKPDTPIRNLANIGFFYDGSSSVVVEFRPDVLTGEATLLSYSSLSNSWVSKKGIYPLGKRQWIGHRPIVDGHNIIWLDLSVGLLTCHDLNDRLQFTYIPLPEDNVLPEDHQLDLVRLRCCAMSDGHIRYVETCHEMETGEVFIEFWTLTNQHALPWHHDGTMSLKSIWNEKDYIDTELPHEIPSVALIDPLRVGTVYFFLQGKIFGVDIIQHSFFTWAPFNMKHPPELFHSSAVVFPWVLPRDLFDAAASDRLGPEELPHFCPPHRIPLFLSYSLDEQHVKMGLRNKEAPYAVVELGLQFSVHSVMSDAGDKGFSGIVQRTSSGEFMGAACFAYDSTDFTSVFSHACYHAISMARRYAMNMGEEFNLNAVLLQSDQFASLEDLLDERIPMIDTMVKLLQVTRHLIVRITHESNDGVILAKRAKEANVELGVYMSLPGKMPLDWLGPMKQEALGTYILDEPSDDEASDDKPSDDEPKPSDDEPEPNDD